MAKKTKNNKPMKRRSFLKGAGAAALGAATISSFRLLLFQAAIWNGLLVLHSVKRVF